MVEMRLVKTRSNSRRSTRTTVSALVLGCAALWTAVQPAGAQLSLGLSQRSADGTTYEVITVPNSPLLGGADEMRVTAVAGSSIGLQPCSSIGASAGLFASALVGGDLALNPPQTLHPFGTIVRTAVLTPNNFTLSFLGQTVTGGGRLRIGTGASAIDICRNSVDCAGGPADAAVVPLTSSSGGVPAACIANGATAFCASGGRSTIGFGLPSVGNVCTSAPTSNSTVCGVRPADGFTLQKGQVLVIIYHTGIAATGFTMGASGFGIDTDGVNTPACSSPNRIVTADAQGPSAPSPPVKVTEVGAPALSGLMLAVLTMALAAWGFLRLRRQPAAVKK